MGTAWTADYLKVTGELDVDLRSNIAAEARAMSSGVVGRGVRGHAVYDL